MKHIKLFEQFANESFKSEYLYVLVDLDNPGNSFSRIFLNEKDAKKAANTIGGNWKINRCFINEK